MPTVYESPLLLVRARGPLAVFTQPALKVERVSAPVITPSAARGLIEAILWKPAISWRIERIRVLRPIRFISFRRNEVNSKAPAPSAAVTRYEAPAPVLFADDDRAQRNTVALRDVDYVIEARFTLTSRAGPGDNVRKFVETFRRRVERGQHFYQPFFGCREFAADVLEADDAPPAILESRALGLLLWDILHGPDGVRPVFFHAELRNGVLEVPAEPPAIRGGMEQGRQA